MQTLPAGTRAEQAASRIEPRATPWWSVAVGGLLCALTAVNAWCWLDDAPRRGFVAEAVDRLERCREDQPRTQTVFRIRATNRGDQPAKVVGAAVPCGLQAVDVCPVEVPAHGTKLLTWNVLGCSRRSAPDDDSRLWLFTDLGITFECRIPLVDAP